MGETILDGTGSGYLAKVDEDNRLFVRTEGLNVGSLSVTAGSQAYLFGKSGADYYPLLSTSGTDGGKLIIDGTFSAETGSNVWVQNFGDLGSTVVIDSPATIGSYTTQGVIGSVAVSNFGVLGSNRTISAGSVIVTNRVAGSIVNLPGVDINNPATIGSYTTQNVSFTGSVSVYQVGSAWGGTGSVHITNTTSATLTGSLEVFSSTGSVQVYGTLSASAGSEQYIKAGSISLLNSLGSTLIFGSVVITSGTSYVNVIQGTSPWVVSGTSTIAGSVFSTGSINIATNLASIGSYTTQTVVGSEAITNFGVLGSQRTISAGSVMITNIVGVSGTAFQTVWTGIGSVRVSAFGANISGQVSIIGSVQPFNIPRADYAQNTTTLITTGLTSILSAGGAGSFHDLTSLDLTNERSITSLVFIYDQSGTSVSPVLKYSLAPKGGVAKSWDYGFLQGGAGSAWYATISGTAGSVHVNIQARKRI